MLIIGEDCNDTKIHQDDTVEILNGEHKGKQGRAEGWTNDCLIVNLSIIPGKARHVSIPGSDLRLIQRATERQLLTQEST